MPRCTAARPGAVEHAMVRLAASTKSGRLRRVDSPRSFSIMLVDILLRPLLQNLLGHLQTSGFGFGVVGGGLGIGEHQAAHALAESAPEFKQDVTADGAADKNRFADFQLVTEPGEVFRMLLHGGRPVAATGLAHAAQSGMISRWRAQSFSCSGDQN